MKKNYFKKSLSLIMTVLMLMSCWVFVAPEHSEVSAAEADNATVNYNNSTINGITDKNFNTALNTVYGKFTIDVSANVEGNYSDAQRATVYKNLIYSPTVTNNTNEAPSAVRWSNVTLYRAGNYIRYYFPNTVMVDDGSVDPSTPVVMAAMASTANYITPLAGYIRTNNGITLAGSWKGYGESSNVEAPQFLQAYFAPSTTTTLSNTSSYGSYVRHDKNKAYFWTNVLAFTGTVDASKYYSAIKPDLCWIGGNNNTEGQKTLTPENSADGQVNKTIYVLKYDTLKTAIGQAKTIYNNIVSNPGRYTTASVKKYVELANALLAARPGNYITSSTAESSLATQVSAYGTAAKNAVTAWNNWYNAGGLSDRTYEITYENLFSLSDWWNSNSAISGGKRTVTVDITAGKVTVDNAETVVGSEVVTNHSGSTSTAGTRNTANYAIPVTAGKSYTIKYTTDHNDTQMFAFFYDVNGGCTHSGSYGAYNFTVNKGTGQATFTAPAGSTQMEIRFDNNQYMSTANYWDIMIYEADRAAEIELDTWTNRPVRKVYTYNNTFRLSDLTTPVRPGYQFDGWYLDAEYTNPYSNFDGTYTFTTDSGAASFPAYAKWSKKTLDIGYDNLFSVSGWADSAEGAKTNRGGAITVDRENGTISIENPSNATSNDNNYTPWTYAVPVDPSTEYIFVYDTDIVGTTGTQIHIFYKTSAEATSYTGFPNSPYVKAEGHKAKNTIVFTPPAGTTHVSFRFGTTDGAGMTNVFSNIGLYKKVDYDAYANSYSKIREPFKVGDTTNLMYPSRDGYVFDGWERADGTKIENVTGLKVSETVYATWTKLWTVTFLNGDGSVLGTATAKDGAAATAPAQTPVKDSDAGYSYEFSSWDKDFSNVTADMTVTPKFISTAHTVTYTLVSARTCETNAIVDKYCSGCGYVFFYAEEYDGTEIAEYIELGHSYDSNRVVTGSTTGEDGTHKIECVRYLTCGSTQTVSHNYAQGTTDNADCVTPGTVNWKCPCGQTKTTAGDIAPDVHNNPTTINAKAATCTEEGYTGDTYCNDCKKTVKEGTTIAKLDHSFTKYVYNNDAECEIDGTETAKCDRCDVTDTQKAEGTALEHSWTDTTRYLKSAANCTDDEVYYKECSLCGISSESKTGATWTKANTAWEHRFNGDYVTNNNGTHVQECTNEGCTATGNEQNCTYGNWTTDNAVTHSHTCTACNYTPTAEDHKWTAWESTNSAGTVAGQQTRTCETCGRTETKNCTYDTTHYNATCTAPERTEYKCSDCGHGYSVIGKPATGHNFSGEVKSYNDGTHAFLCENNCGSYGFDGTANAKTNCSYSYTNTASGTHKAECTVCSYSYSEDCSGGQATCTEEAVCENCKTAYGDKADHSFNGAAFKLEGDVHAYLCEFCGKTTGIYGIGSTVNGTEACSGGTATCSALAECTVCGDTHGELDADAHKWGAAVTDTANAGKHIYTCEYDEEHTKNEACESGSAQVVAPKCEEQGYTIQTCKECSYKWNTDYVDATDHNWVDPVDNKNGTHTLSCDNENVDGWVCDETLTRKCADSAISYGLELATCTEQGYEKYQCAVCNYSWNGNYEAALGHDYTEKIYNDAHRKEAANCEHANIYWYDCSRCDKNAKDETDTEKYTTLTFVSGNVREHKWINEVADEYLAAAATCTAAAKYYTSCEYEDCGKSSLEVLGEEKATKFSSGAAPLGHEWVHPDDDELANYKVISADCITDATYYYVCSRCDISSEGVKKDGETWTDVGSMSGHNLEHHEAVAATCDTAGNHEYWYCSTCKEYFKNEDASEAFTGQSATIIKKREHETVTVASKAATCEEDGNPEYKYCKYEDCDYTTYPETLPDGYKATGHKFTGAYYCDTANNYHSKYCVNKSCTATGIVVDGEHVKYEVIYDGLDYIIKGGEACNFTGEYVSETDENGVHSHKLSCVCGNATSAVCVDSAPETVAPTCTEDGYTVHICETCDYEWKTDIVDALGHDLADTASSNGDGTHSVKCSRCDYAADAEDCSGGTATCKDKAVCAVCNTAYGETTDHTYDETKWEYQEDATCTQDGTEKNNCTVCGEEATRTAEDTAAGHSMISDYVYDISGWTNMPEDFDEEIKAPTCQAEGLGIIYCQNCDYYKTMTFKADKNAHKWETDENGELVWVVLSGDCGTGVTLKNTCTVCGSTQTKKETGDHDWHLAYSYDPTCTQPGIIKEVCYVCKAEKVTTRDEDPTLAPKAHTYGEPVKVEANCDEAAHTEETCTVCGYVLKYDYTGDVAHTFDKGMSFKGTCENDGYTEYTCTECNFVEKVVTEKADGHTDNDGNGECDDCREVMYDDSDSAKGCGCICHKDSWLMKFIYRILNFFWKLFKISKSCECGAVHW